MNRIAYDLAVFLPNYNHARYLEAALNALLAQSVQPVIISVVDDGSDDGSVEVIERYASHFENVKPVFNATNRGIYRNMIDWLSSVDRRYVYFGASDDIVAPGLFDQSLGLLRQHPESGLCSALCRIIDSEGRDKGMLKTPVVRSVPGFISSDDVRRLLMRDDGWFNGSSTIYRRDALLAVGGFDPQLKSFIDGFAARIVAVTHGACFVPEPLAYWRRDDTGLAGQTSANVDEALAVAERTEELIQTRYARLFPQGYSALWRGRWMFGVYRANLRADDLSRWRAARHVLRRFPWLENAMFSTPMVRIRIWRSLLVSYGFLALRHRDILPVIGRRLKHVFGLWRNPNASSAR